MLRESVRTLISRLGVGGESDETSMTDGGVAVSQTAGESASDAVDDTPATAAAESDFQFPDEYDGAVVAWNHSMEQLTGSSAFDAMGETDVSRVFYPDDRRTKTLADETRTHTEQITTSIEEIQAQTDSTWDAAEGSHERIGHAGEQISEVLEAFEGIASAIDEAADGIAEVSRATDDQAATVEELTATIETVQERAE